MKRTKPETPINDFLNENIKRNPVSFHMPGHKYRAGGISSFDITEIHGADNIKKPGGIIKQSLEMISTVYGSKRAFFLTNGTSQGIHSVMRYAAAKGGSMIVSRDCHISAVNAAVMFGVNIIFVETYMDKGIPVPVKPDELTRTIDSNPDACGVLITSPNYYGMAADIHAVAGAAHKAGMFLAIDEAHGAHLEFAGLGNLSGIRNGADIVCHSLHKTMPVYNQGAVLHICSDRIDGNTLEEAINMTGTTSPSYPMMASMEKAVSDYYSDSSCYDELKKLIESLTGRINTVKTDDFTRIVIKTPGNGFGVSKLLHAGGVDIESADFNHIVLISTPKNTPDDFEALAKAMENTGAGDFQKMMHQPMPERKLKLSEAYDMARESIPLDMAAGRICGTIIVSYPPGTPVLCPGEIVDGYAIDYIRKIMDSGGTVLGMDNKKIPVLEQT